ncbi:T9SS type A sorting domain-containing protein [Rapidithrix thailandica]|uniref:T9SS type A sorting domain-containing protein n=1 Tax=Rapidithrix thailandica TaxID=413964 RepID=A0AAW9SAP1_9BACT
MKRCFTLLALCIFFYQYSFAQFQHSYGLDSRESGYSVQMTQHDNGFIVAGTTSFPVIAGGDATLMKTDPAGNPLWQMAYGGERYEQFNSVRYIGNQGYGALGHTNSFGFGNHDMYFVRTDFNGNPITSKIYGGEKDDRGHCIQRIKDPDIGEGFIMVGETQSFPHILPGKNVYVVLTDLLGNVKRAVVLGYKYDQIGYWIEQTRDGGYILVGSSTLNCTGGNGQLNDIYVVRLKPDLSVMWDRYIGGELNDEAFCVKETPKGNFIITGYTQSFGVGSQGDAYLLSLDAAGNFQWMRTYGLERVDIAKGLIIDQNSTGSWNYVVSGYTNSVGPNNAYMFKTDANGNLLWTNTYGIDNYDYSYELTRSKPGYVFTGSVSSYGAGSNDIYLVETDLNGKSGTDCEIRMQQEVIRHQPCITKITKFEYVKPELRVDSRYERTDFVVKDCPFGSHSSAKEAQDNNLNKLAELKSEANGIRIYPNPSAHRLNLSYISDFQNSKIRIIPITGQQVVLQTTLQNLNKAELDISQLVKGLYILEITKTDGQVQKLKFLKE